MKKLAVILGMLFTLSVNAQVTISPSATAICQGNSVTFVANATGYGNDTLNFTWLQNGVGFGMPNNDSITYVPTVGSWNVTVNVTTPSGQFVGTGFATLTVNTLPTASASNTGPYCEMGSILLQSGGGSTYSWTGPLGFTSSFQNPTIGLANVNMSGTYTVTVTDNNGCSASANTNVVVNSLPTANAGSNSPVCVGNTIGLTASGGVSYVWSGPGAYSSNAQNPIRTNATLAMGGNYSVTVTDGNGCVALATTPVVVNPNPTVTAGSLPVSCFGDSTGLVSVSQNGLSYLWNTGDTTQTVNGVPAGTYSVTATNNFGCVATATATVTQPLAAVTASISITDASCNGNADGAIAVSGAGGNGPYQYRINNGPWMGGLGYTFTGLVAGTYTIDVRDANACQITLTASVFQPSIVTANADSSVVSCNGGSDGTVWVLPNGGTPPYTYVWSNGSTTQYVSSLTAGTYGVTVTDANGCTVSAATAVTQPNPITFSPITSNALCNGGNGTISFTNVGGGTAPYTYSINGGNTYGTNSTSSVPVGSYQLRVMDANGCSTTNVPIAISAPTAMQLTIADTNAVCGGNGIASVFASGGTAPYNFLWSNGSINDSIFVTPGNYTVTVTDANGCMAVGAATIGQPIIPTITGSATDVSCFGLADGSVDITPSGVGPFTYNWSNGSTNQDLVNVGAGIYTIIVIGANNCIGTNQFTVNQPAVLATNVPSTTVACNGNLGSLTASVTGGTGPYSYTWSTTPAQTVQTATNLTAGLAYTVTVTDANGCTTQATGSVLQPTVLSVNVTPQNINCVGNTGSATATVTGGTPFPGGSYQFLWSNGSQLNQAFGLSFGNHSVTVTDANGCSVTQTFIISPGNSFVLSLQATDGCQGQSGGSITTGITGGSGNFSYVWNNGWTGSSFTALTSGTYSVTVTDLNSGCSQTASTQVQVHPAIDVALPSQITVCSGNTTLVYANVSGGTLPSNFAYQWQLPTGQLQTGVGPTGVNPVVTGLYTLTVSEGNCSGSATVFINVSPIAEPVAAFGYVQNNPYNFTFTSSSANASSLIWIINNQIAGSGQQFTYNFPVTGFYDVKLVASNECGSDTTSQLIGIGVTGISDLASENVKIFPNPISSGGTATVQIPLNIHDVTIDVISITGQVLSQEKISGSTHHINTSGLSPGIYTIRIASGNEVAIKRLVIQ